MGFLDHMAALDFPGSSVVKNLPNNISCLTIQELQEDSGLLPGWGRSPGGGGLIPLQYSCLKNSMDRGAWRATGHGVAKSQTRLSDWACTVALVLVRDHTSSYAVQFLSHQDLKWYLLTEWTNVWKKWTNTPSDHKNYYWCQQTQGKTGVSHNRFQPQLYVKSSSYPLRTTAKCDSINVYFID